MSAGVLAPKGARATGLFGYSLPTSTFEPRFKRLPLGLPNAALDTIPYTHRHFALRPPLNGNAEGRHRGAHRPKRIRHLCRRSAPSQPNARYPLPSSHGLFYAFSLKRSADLRLLVRATGPPRLPMDNWDRTQTHRVHRRLRSNRTTSFFSANKPSLPDHIVSHVPVNPLALPL